jgi:hypothetical protein
MTQEIEKVTRHEGSADTIFQVHHFKGVNPEIHPLAEIGKVFIEGKDGLLRFSGGCAKRILALPQVKEKKEEAAPVTEAKAPLVKVGK